MKKLLFVALLGTLVACGEASTETTTTDTAAHAVDTTVAPATDTIKAIDTTGIADTTKAIVDTTKH